MKNEWSKVSLVFLFLVAFIGTLLRSWAYIPIPLEYPNLVHAHSHVAFQGWVYLIILLLLTRTFLHEDKIKKGRYALQFKLTVFVVIGVLISFWLQGYALYSILFSTLFQLLNYWFIFRFLRDSNRSGSTRGKPVSLRLIRTGLWWGLLSTMLPFGIGILSAKGLSGTEIYQSFVYTFLHLQYNGWFLFVVLGLLFNYFDRHGISYNQKNAVRFFWCLTFAVVPSIALSLLGMEFSNYLILPAYLSVVLLTTALLFFLRTIPRNLISSLKNVGYWFKLYFMAFLMAFVLKMILQCLSVFPFFETFAFRNKSIIIAYLHLSLIGSISFLLLAVLIDKKWLPLNGFVKTGSVLLIAGFATTELLLVSTGLGIYNNQVLLVIGSAAMALGIFLMLIKGSQTKKEYGTI